MQRRDTIIQRVFLTGSPEEVTHAINNLPAGFRFVSQSPVMMHDGIVDVQQAIFERPVREVYLPPEGPCDPVQIAENAAPVPGSSDVLPDDGHCTGQSDSGASPSSED